MSEVKMNYRRNLKVPANRMVPFSWFVIDLKRSSKKYICLDKIKNYKKKYFFRKIKNCKKYIYTKHLIPENFLSFLSDTFLIFKSISTNGIFILSSFIFLFFFSFFL